MFTLVVLLAGIAFASGAPHYAGVPVLDRALVQEPVVTKVGELVQTVPTAVSYQSQTQYHSRKRVTPILAPVVRSYAVPVDAGYHSTIAEVPQDFVAPQRHTVEPTVSSYGVPIYPSLKLYPTSTSPGGVLTTYSRTPLYTSVHQTHYPATIKSYAPYVYYP